MQARAMAAITALEARGEVATRRGIGREAGIELSHLRGVLRRLTELGLVEVPPGQAHSQPHARPVRLTGRVAPVSSPAPNTGLGVNQRVVLAALAERGTSYLKELHRDTGIPVGHVARTLAAFRTRGLAEPATLPVHRGLPDSVRPVRLTAAGRDAANRKVAQPRTPSGADLASKTPLGPVVGRGNPKERS